MVQEGFLKIDHQMSSAGTHSAYIAFHTAGSFACMQHKSLAKREVTTCALGGDFPALQLSAQLPCSLSADTQVFLTEVS